MESWCNGGEGSRSKGKRRAMIIGMGKKGWGSWGRACRRCKGNECRRGGGADEEDLQGADGRRRRAKECITLGAARGSFGARKGGHLHFRTSVVRRCGWSAGEYAKD